MSRLLLEGTAVAVLGLGGVVLVRAPRLAFAAFLVSVCFLPVWADVTLKISFEPHVLGALALAVSLVIALVASRGPSPAGRLAWGDVLFLAFLLAGLVPVLTGGLDLSDGFVLIVQWTGAYLAGRLVGRRLPLDRVHAAIALAFTAVAALALVEFLTGWNPFLHIPGSADLRAVWATVQMRGGHPRAEGAFGTSIALGAALAMAVPITLAAPFRPWLRLLMTALMLAAEVVTFSRIGLVTAVLGVILAVFFLPNRLPLRLRVAATAGMAVLVAASASFLSSVFQAAGTEATNSADYRLTLLSLVRDLLPFGYASSSYRLASGHVVLANVPSNDGIEHSIDNALLLLGLTYGWVPLVAVLAALLVAVVCVLARRSTPATVALVAQIPAFASVALVTQYATLTWFIAGLAVVGQALRAPGAIPAVAGGSLQELSGNGQEKSPGMVAAPVAHLHSPPSVASNRSRASAVPAVWGRT